MRFPRTEPANADGHESALARLDEARGEERNLAARRDAAEPGAADARTDAQLSAAADQVAAREVWASWASRDE